MEEMIEMAGSNCQCGGPGLESMSTQDLRDLFAIFSRAAFMYSTERDEQLGTLIAIREELKRRVEACY